MTKLINNWTVEPKRQWINKTTKQTASVYGAVPYVSEADKQNWFIAESGYTLRNNHHNTIGANCVPAGGFGSLSDAQAAADKLNSF